MSPMGDPRIEFRDFRFNMVAQSGNRVDEPRLMAHA
jgi:hypothetical protein